MTRTTPTLADHARRWADLEPHVKTLTRLARSASHVLDLGVREGVSAWAFLDGIGPDGIVTSVDIDASSAARVPVRVSEDPRWRFVAADTRDPAFWRAAGRADLVFIDTSHTYDATMTELYGAALAGARVVALHDYAWAGNEGVRTAVGEFVARGGYDLVTVEPSAWGLAILERR